MTSARTPQTSTLFITVANDTEANTVATGTSQLLILVLVSAGNITNPNTQTLYKWNGTTLAQV